MARKGSRSYSDPAYRESVLRLAPEDAYRRAVKDVNHRVVQYVQQAYQSDPHFLTNRASIDRLTAIMAPAVEAGQLQIADLTNAHLSTLFGVEHPPSPNLSTFERPNISRTRELARPFWTAIKAAQAGKDFDAALAAGEARLTKMVETDLQMAKVRQAREVLKAGGIRRYARVTGGNACWLCEIAATQVYYTEDLLPIHPSCNCSVQPIPEGGEAEIRKGFTPEEILRHSDDQVKLMLGLVEGDAPLGDYQDLVAVREHGEVGPVLTWKHQSFTGPSNLPVHASGPKSAVAQEVQHAVHWTGPPVAEPLMTKTAIEDVDYPWTSESLFDSVKGPYREGARYTQRFGSSGAWRPVPGEYLNDDVNFDRGAQFVSRAVHSEPTTESLWRGMGMKTEDIDALIEGKKLSLPLSSFSSDQDQAREFLGSHRIADGAQRVRFELLPGAKVADVPSFIHEGEKVVFGQFEVVSAKTTYTRTGGYPITRIQLRQTSMIEADVAQAKSMPRGAKKIPEYTIVGKGKPSNANAYLTPQQMWPSPGFKTVKLEVDNLPPEVQKEIRDTMLDLTARFPQAQVQEVYSEARNAVRQPRWYAETEHFNARLGVGPPDGRKSMIWMNPEWFGDQKAYEAAFLKDVKEYWHPPLGKKGTPTASTVAHEFAHGLDMQGSERTGKEASKKLKAYALEQHPEWKKLDKLAREDAYSDWLREQVPEYGLRHRVRPYEARMSSPLVQDYVWSLNGSEATANAFSDVYFNGDKATDASKFLNDLLIKNSMLPPSNEGVYWAEDWAGNRLRKPSPASVVAEKEAKRAAAQAKKEAAAAEKAAAKAAAQAEKEAAKAAKAADLATPEGQIREARLQKLKGEQRLAAGDFGAPDSIENVTRSKMDPERIRRNREALWDEVPEPVRTEGKAWYPADGQVLLDIHKELGSPLAADPLADLKVRALGSAFSPQVDWADAKTDVRNYLSVLGQPYQDRVDAIVKGRPRMVYTDSIKRADRVMAATTPEEIDLALRGSQPTTSHYYDNSQKIRHFFPNLDGNLDLLTADTWDGRAARLHPDERRFLINEEIREKNFASKHPVPLEDLDLYQKGDRIPGYLVARADKLADAANDAARAAGRPEPYLPSAPLMVQHGYDILESATAAALPEGYKMADYQAGMWVWLRGSA